MNELQKVYDVLTQIYSKDGYKADKYVIKAESPSVSQVSYGSDGEIEIDFVDNAPVVEVKKIILWLHKTISITVLGIVLKKDGGIIKLHRFPDISFKYDKPPTIPSEYFEQPETD